MEFDEGIFIIPMTESTLEGVAALERECFSTPWSKRALAYELSNPNAVFLTAVNGGNVVGYAGMHAILDEGYVTNVAVTASYRRQGIGQALVQALVDYGQEHDLSFISLEVRVSNESAIALYADMGFREEGLRKNFYSSPKEDGLIMTRHLGDRGVCL